MNRRNVITGAIVGGPKDVLITKSRIYTSSSEVRGNVGGTVGATPESSRKRKKANQVKVEEKEEEEGEGEDMEAESEKSANNSGDEVEPVPAVELKDFTSYPDLQGPPRVGDKLAFKVL